MLVISMLDQRVVGVVGLDAAGSRIRMPSAKAPGACLGHEPGDTKGQQRSQADSRDPAMTSANALEQQRSRRHAVHGIQEVRRHLGQRSRSTLPHMPQHRRPD
jgi:hypothetical protein